MGRKLRVRLLIVAAAGGATLLSASIANAGNAPALKFDAPVALTSGVNGGFEPGIEVDRYGNIFVTAHKLRAENFLGPDQESPAGVRAASWVWTSADGRSFHDVSPGDPPASNYLYSPGDEGDLAIDTVGNAYFIDTWVTDTSFTRWHSSGRGDIVLKEHRPETPTYSAVDDRPWIAASADGTVMEITNGGVYPTNPVAQGATGGNGDAVGPGRITAYISHDFGHTFDSAGVMLKDSGWCHPAADPRPGSRTWYINCNETTAPGQDQSGAIWSFVTHDDGAMWTRQRVATAPSAQWPASAVARDGTAYFLIPDDTGPHTVLRLFSSADGGKSWKETKVPWAGPSIADAWMAVASNGMVGIGLYSQLPDGNAPWQVYAIEGTAATGWSFGQVSTTTIAGANNNPEGDFFQVAFDPQNRLNVVWTDASNALSTANDFETGGYAEVVYARQVLGAQIEAQGSQPAVQATPLPNTGGGNAGGVVLLVAAMLAISQAIVRTRRRST